MDSPRNCYRSMTARLRLRASHAVRGPAIGLQLLEAGGRVLLAARLGVTSDALSSFGDCQPIATDVTIDVGIAEVVRAVDAEAGEGLNSLMNNARRAWGGSLKVIPRSARDRVFATNVTGMFTLTTALCSPCTSVEPPPTRTRIVNTGSIDGSQPSVFEKHPYAASKAAVHLLTRRLASRPAGDRITVNAVTPGAFLTDMTAFIARVVLPVDAGLSGATP